VPTVWLGYFSGREGTLVFTDGVVPGVDKSSYHRLSHFEIGGDNPCGFIYSLEAATKMFSRDLMASALAAMPSHDCFRRSPSDVNSVARLLPVANRLME
jgi:hypothetical protein